MRKRANAAAVAGLHLLEQEEEKRIKREERMEVRRLWGSMPLALVATPRSASTVGAWAGTSARPSWPRATPGWGGGGQHIGPEVLHPIRTRDLPRWGAALRSQLGRGALLSEVGGRPVLYARVIFLPVQRWWVHADDPGAFSCTNPMRLF